MPISARFQLTLLLCVAVLFGGGGVAYGLMNLGVQLVALAVLAANREAFAAFWTKAPRSLAVLVALSIAIPVMQLIPLRPDWWQALPGRELAAEARNAVGATGWFGISLDRNRTLVALSGLIAPVCVLLLAWRLSQQELVRAGQVLVALALANFLIGVPQVLSNGAAAIPYPENPMPGVLFGTFANRNSTGIFLVACLAFLALPSRRDGASKLPYARLVIGALLIVAIVLTRSRSAMVLAGLPLGLIALQNCSPSRWSPTTGWKSPAFGLIGAVAVLGALAVAVPNTRIAHSVARFSGEQDARSYIWDDATFAAQRYWPVGAGMGTFDEVFQADESLENLTERRAGRAHNDYL
ncbi:MAG: O-antigen ligase domain-containing protein, partial [Alphaproteobacteria bacterium]